MEVGERHLTLLAGKVCKISFNNDHTYSNSYKVTHTHACTHTCAHTKWYNSLVHLHEWPHYLQTSGFESHLWPVEFFFFIWSLHPPSTLPRVDHCHYKAL